MLQDRVKASHSWEGSPYAKCVTCAQHLTTLHGNYFLIYLSWFSEVRNLAAFHLFIPNTQAQCVH